MRQVVLDTETTGLAPEQGHRIIEIGCVEVVNRRLTGERLHLYLQPDRSIDAGALEVHGITEEFLRDKPRFADIVGDFLAFVSGAELIIHNAPFDLGFLNHELRLASAQISRLEDVCTVVDTLVLARSINPGGRNSLDALCRRYHVDHSGRSLHGAALDAGLLAEVYLAMTGGQVALGLEQQESGNEAEMGHWERQRPAVSLRVIEPNASECTAHAEMLDVLDRERGSPCLWRTLDY